MNAVELTKNVIDEVLNFIEDSPWRTLYEDRIRILKDRLNFPCELAIIGRVKAGKSSFLNALLGEDLALVGNTETTATINFFKYGKPIDDLHPVKVIWSDGKEEWQTIEFLNSLQGNDKTTLERAKNIDHLEYFVLNPILSNITLVDTPGTGALVDEHEQRTSDYLSSDFEQLRKKHEEQSLVLKSRADAVVVITERVPTSATNELISRLSNDTSAFNALGIMTKIDMEESTTDEDWKRRCEKYSSMLRNQLNTILPVSAGIYHAVKKLCKTERINQIQKQIKLIPKEYFDELFDGDRSSFLSEGDDYDSLFSTYGLPYTVRKEMVGNLDWEVFYRIAKELYYNSVEASIEVLIKFSGMEKVKSILEQQFFNRSRIIRCVKTISEIKNILNEISIRRLYDLRFNVTNRHFFLEIINDSSAPKYVKEAFKEFVIDNIVSLEDYERYESSLNILIRKIEELLSQYSSVDSNVEGLLLLDKHHEAFKDDEIEEIECLLGKRNWSDKSKIADNNQRQLYWRGRKNMSFNKEVKKIIEIVLDRYESIE